MKPYLQIIFFAIILNSGCNQDNPELCPSIVDIGNYELIEESKEFVPYDNVQSIIFIDSLNNEIIFEVDSVRNWFGNGSISKFCSEDSQSTDRITYTFLSESKIATFSNDSLNYVFSIWLNSRPYRVDPTSEKVADVIQIGMEYDVNGNQASKFLMQFKANNRTYPDDWINTENVETINLLNQQFTNVFTDETEIGGNIIKTHYNKEFGLIGITDLNGKQLVFKEFQ